MKDIFSDLYDKVLSFFSTTPNVDETKSVAKSRLRTVLAQDRVGFSERAMQMLKDDLIDNISKYLEIDINSFDLSIDAKEDTTVLNLSIPVLRPKSDEEIDEALACQEKAKIEKTHEIVGEIEELVKEKAQALAETMTDDKTSSEKNEESDDKKEDEKSDDEENKNSEEEQVAASKKTKKQQD